MQFQGGVRLGGPLVSEVTHQYFEGMNPCSFYFFVRILAVFFHIPGTSIAFVRFSLHCSELDRDTQANMAESKAALRLVYTKQRIMVQYFTTACEMPLMLAMDSVESSG